MEINIENGDFAIDKIRKIKVNQPYNEVLHLNDIRNTSDFQNGYSWIYFKTINTENLYFYISVGFFQKKVNRISFSFTETDLSNGSWSDWSEDDEKAKEQKFENWLNNKIGKLRSFKWGEVSAIYDSKGSSTSISINYK